MWIFGIANELEIGSVSVEVSKVSVPFSSLSIAELAQLEAVLLFVAKNVLIRFRSCLSILFPSLYKSRRWIFWKVGASTSAAFLNKTIIYDELLFHFILSEVTLLSNIYKPNLRIIHWNLNKSLVENFIILELFNSKTTPNMRFSPIKPNFGRCLK